MSYQRQERMTSSSSVVHKTYNSPMGLYSPQNASAVLNQKAQTLANGGVGVDFRYLGQPNLAKSEVLKMVQEEEGSQKTGERRKFRAMLPPPIPWPPKAEDRFSPSFFIHSEEIRKVAWPPTEDELAYYPNAPDQTGAFYGPADSQQYHPQGGQWAMNGPNASSPTPMHPQHQPPSQTVQLRQQVPVHQAPNQVYDAQPSVKRHVPFKCRGDLKWPPETWRMKMAMERDLLKGEKMRPRKNQRDYRPFFEKNAINFSYPPYKPPPGTQHYYEYILGMQGNL